MAIDIELIEKTTIKLSKKLIETREETRDIQKLVATLQLISGKDPKDPITEEPMNKERINEIFNSVAKKSAKYIGGKNNVN